MKISDLISIITLLISFLAILISYLSYRTNKRKLFISSLSSYRIDWIKNIRELSREFISGYLSQDIEKMRLYKYKIDTYLNFKYNKKDILKGVTTHAVKEEFIGSHRELSLLLEKITNGESKNIDEFIILLQIQLDDYWQTAKVEAGVTKNQAYKFRKEVFGERAIK